MLTSSIYCAANLDESERQEGRCGASALYFIVIVYVTSGRVIPIWFVGQSPHPTPHTPHPTPHIYIHLSIPTDLHTQRQLYIQSYSVHTSINGHPIEEGEFISRSLLNRSCKTL